MRFRRRCRPRAAIVLVCGCTLASLYLFQRDVWHGYAMQDGSATERFVARYESLRPLLPTDEVIGFALDQRHVDARRMYPGARLFLAQYALSPRLVANRTTTRWVIVDSDSPEIVPEMATSAHWALTADLGNGVRLYRTDVKE
jgi:hypothetical protein